MIYCARRLVLSRSNPSPASHSRYHHRSGGIKWWSLYYRLWLFANTTAASTTTTAFTSSCDRIMSIHNEKVRHIDANLVPEWFKIERTKVLSPTEMMVEKYATTAAATAATGSTTTTTSSASASVIYWMQRDVRSVDNWALALAAHLADATSATLRVVYALPPPTTTTTRLLMEEEEEEEEDDDDESDKSTIIPDLKHLGMTERHGKFLLGGLECVHQELKQHDIPLHIVKPKDYDHVGTDVCDQVILKYHAQIVITDMSPLRHYREWTELQALPILNQNNIVFYQVDTHNIVPVWIASDKREYGARTIRPKINKQYHLYLQKFPRLEAFQLLANKNKTNVIKIPDFERQRYEEYMQMDASVKELTWCQPGTQAGLKQAEFFFANGLPKFDALRNDPTETKIISNLSPWINHGHVSFQRLAMAVKKLNKHANGTSAFLEEGIVRRELSDNYVYYSPDDYDSLDAAAEWAKETLQLHAADQREYLYTLTELEQGLTHDDLWNAAQLQGVRDGKIHGFMRMYWAKKILEWTESPEIALRTALYFNDKYCIDGRCPNGFVGVGWSIMGIHDMGWKERDVFGKIRYMNYNGCKRKFKVPVFVARYKGAAENAAEAVKKHLGKRKLVSSEKKSSKKAKSTK